MYLTSTLGAIIRSPLDQFRTTSISYHRRTCNRIVASEDVREDQKVDKKAVWIVFSFQFALHYFPTSAAVAATRRSSCSTPTLRSCF